MRGDATRRGMGRGEHGPSTSPGARAVFGKDLVKNWDAGTLGE